MIRVLFVCMGNICRSPTAQGAFTSLLAARGLLDRVQVDSAGTHDYHVGKPPDARARRAALSRGVDITHLRARQVSREDFDRFDYVLAMDESNLRDLMRQSSSPKHQDKLRLFLDFASDRPERDVPDPYYGGEAGFERVLDLVQEASVGLLEELQRLNRL